ncbi:MAG: SBBP repeat-containing protein [Anaerolineae bacterium]|jgi:hypothetical protein
MSKNTQRLAKGLQLLVVTTLLVIGIDTPTLALPAVQPEHGAVPGEGREAPEWLRFTADRHVMGFEPNGVYVVGSDHMVRVTFIDGTCVLPHVDARPSRNGTKLPLGRVSYPHLWEGVTLIYERAEGGIARSSYLIEPAADVGQIRLRYNVPVELDAGGYLVMRLQTGEMMETAPVAWQEINGDRVPVDVAFRLVDAETGSRRSAGTGPEVGFGVGEYDLDYALMIDPTLVWHTFLGGTAPDYGRAIAVDGNGDVYVVGDSEAAWGSPLRAHQGGYDAFAAKLNANGQLLWHTFLGGTDDDYGGGIAVDGSGGVYVGGVSGATWGAGECPGCPVRGYTASYSDAFVAKLDSSGQRQWNTFLGGAADDYGAAVAVDRSGNVYAGGDSGASWGAGACPGCPVRSYTASQYDAFAAKLNAGGQLQWNTFLGGAGDDRGSAIVADGGGNVYLAGSTGWAGWGSPVRAYQGDFDALVAKLDGSGQVVWNTFLGSPGYDVGSGIGVDGSGNVYVGGASSAPWQGTNPPVRSYTSGVDAFAARLDANGQLAWNTFLGGAGEDRGRALAVDGSGTTYVGGDSGVTWQGTKPPSRAYGSGADAFAARLAASGQLEWNTFLGGTGADKGHAIAEDRRGSVYVAGYSSASWGAGECPDCPIKAYTDSHDAFVAKISAVSRPIGGIVLPTHRRLLLAPWLVLASLAGSVVLGVVLSRRHRKAQP